MDNGKYGWTRKLKPGDTVLVRDHLGHWFLQMVEWQTDGIVGIVFHNALGERGGAYEFDLDGVEMGGGARPHHQYARMKMVETTPTNMHLFQELRRKVVDPNWEKYSLLEQVSKDTLYVLTNTCSPVGGGYGRKYVTKVLGTSFDKEGLYRIMLNKLSTRLSYITSDREEAIVSVMSLGKPLYFPGKLILFPILEKQSLIGFTFTRIYRIPGFADDIGIDTCQISSTTVEYPFAFPWDRNSL